MMCVMLPAPGFCFHRKCVSVLLNQRDPFVDRFFLFAGVPMKCTKLFVG